MACFLYEAMILFGIGLIPGLVGAVLMSWAGPQHTGLGETLLRLFAFVFYGVYFVGFWSTRGQTLPMQTWHIRLETVHGRLPSRARAGARYVASWIWIAPPALLGTALHWRPWGTLGVVAGWIVIYAALSWLHPRRQFWHDALCGTRLVDYSSRRPRKTA